MKGREKERKNPRNFKYVSVCYVGWPLVSRYYIKRISDETEMHINITIHRDVVCTSFGLYCTVVFCYTHHEYTLFNTIQCIQYTATAPSSARSLFVLSLIKITFSSGNFIINQNEQKKKKHTENKKAIDERKRCGDGPFLCIIHWCKCYKKDAKHLQSNTYIISLFFFLSTQSFDVCERCNMVFGECNSHDSFFRVSLHSFTMFILFTLTT